MKKVILKSKKVILVPIIIIIILAILGIFLVYYINRTKENATFCVPKIIFYHGANIANDSESSSLTNLNIGQFSDFSIYIDNNKVDSTLTDANTIKELYIDNISVNVKINNGNATFNYKNPLYFGKYTELAPISAGERINFKIISTNKQNEGADYNEPVFFTDCSNPITLGFTNQDIVTKYSISDSSNKVYYNAKVLKEAGVLLDDINPTIHFTIHIVNNLNHHLSCDIRILKPLDEDFLDTGYSYMVNNFPNNKYQFKRD